MKRLSWKYIAGLIDGEGCIDFQCHVDQRNKEKRLYVVPRLRIALAENSLFLLEILKANHGGNLWTGQQNKEVNPNWQNAYYWQVQGKKMRPILQNIVNHLLIKKEQAKFAIWWVDNMMGKQHNGNQDLEAIRQSARDELKAMKRDPQRLSEKAVERISLLMR